ncbi:MAG: hypothetical protein ACKOCK_03150 [Chloroflexota bacterium]
MTPITNTCLTIGTCYGAAFLAGRARGSVDDIPALKRDWVVLANVGQK